MGCSRELEMKNRCFKYITNREETWFSGVGEGSQQPVRKRSSEADRRSKGTGGRGH